MSEINSQPVQDWSAKRRALLASLLQERGLRGDCTAIIPRRTQTDCIPLSFAQRRLWFLSRLVPNSALYHIPSALPLHFPVNTIALERCLNEIVRRHEVLRTSFPIVDGQPVQRIASELHVPLSVVDLRACPDSERNSEVQRLTNLAAFQPFELETGPLLRGSLLILGAADSLFLLTMHHIVSDGWSMQVFFRELNTLYTHFIDGRPSPLPELPIQYGDFTVWQHHRIQGEALEKQLSYWRKQLADLPQLSFPTDRPRPPIATFEGQSMEISVPEGLTSQLKSLGEREGVTLFMTVLAGFQALLHRCTGQDDIVVGVPIAGRNQAELQPLIGFFVNTLVMRCRLSGKMSFRELLQRVREMALEAYSYQDVPFEKVVEELQPARDLSRNPLFQVLFQLQNTPATVPPHITERASAPQVQINSAKFDLTFDLWEDGKIIAGRIEYNAGLFDELTVRQLGGHFLRLLSSAVANPDQTLSALNLLSPEEWQQIVVDWNATAIEFPRDAAIQELFEEQVARHPARVALVFDGQQMTYFELNRRANRLAHHLQGLGVRRGNLVGLCLPRSFEMLIAFLAILKAGGAYVPLDPNYPPERLVFMARDAELSILITFQEFQPLFADGSLSLVFLDDHAAAVMNGCEEKNPAPGTSGEDLAYMMFTSGSTGRPKGVSILHRGVVRLVKGATFADLSSDHVFLQFAPISFDASTFEIWAPLLNGARLVIFSRHFPSLAELGEVVREEGVSTLWLTSALFREMVNGHLEDLKGIRQLLAGGDVLPVAHVRRALDGLPNCVLINGYGPTENTTFTCCYTIDRSRQDGHSVPIGRPIANTQVYVLDSDLQPVPRGVVGELYIAGDGLARGYHRDPELTAEKFLPNPFSKNDKARLYKTGDLVRYLPDGNLEFIGRRDQQVKIRGFRIELGEVEGVLATHPALREALMDVCDHEHGDKSLLAYVTVQPGRQVSPNQLKEFLRRQLPDYMVPSECVVLENLPITPNGKVDRKALRKLEGISSPPVFTPATTELEQQILEIWELVLCLNKIGIHDNFFDLGGHSLLLAQVHARLTETVAGPVSMTDLFQYPTIASLAEALSGSGREIPLLDQTRDRAKRQRLARARRTKPTTRPNEIERF
jgi:amino acid adenylation domain-containing protein